MVFLDCRRRAEFGRVGGTGVASAYAGESAHHIPLRRRLMVGPKVDQFTRGRLLTLGDGHTQSRAQASAAAQGLPSS